MYPLCEKIFVGDYNVFYSSTSYEKNFKKKILAFLEVTHAYPQRLNCNIGAEVCLLRLWSDGDYMDLQLHAWSKSGSALFRLANSYGVAHMQESIIK